MLGKRFGTFLGVAAGLMLTASTVSAQWTPMPGPNNGGGAFWDNPSADGANCNIGFVLNGTATNDTCNNERPAGWLPFAGGNPAYFLGGANAVGFLFKAGTYRIDQIVSASLGGDIASANNNWGIFDANGDVLFPGSGAPFEGDLSAKFTFASDWGFWIDLSRPTGDRGYSDALSSGGMYHHALFANNTHTVNGNVVSLAYGEKVWVSMENNGCQELGQLPGCESLITDRDYNDVLLSVTAVPEPSTYVLMAAGLLGLGIASRRRKVQA